MLYWKKKPVERKGCFKNHWKAIIGGTIIGLCVVFLAVYWGIILVNGIKKYITLRACYVINYNPEDVTEIVIDDRRCWRNYVTSFDVSRYKNVKRIEIGYDNFEYVSEVELIGLKRLESVVIGSYCFDGSDLIVKDCPKLKSLIIGQGSFGYSSLCEIENVEALEVIEIGKLDYPSYSFKYASLELKSILIQSE